MDDFDDGGAGLPDELTTELPDLEIAETEVEIDLEGVIMERAGRTSGGARARSAATPRKSSGGGAPKAAAKKPAAKKPAAKKPAAKKPAKPAAKHKARPAAKKKARPAKKAAKKSAKKAPKKAKRKAGQKK